MTVLVTKLLKKVLLRLPTSLTVSRVLAANIVQRLCSDSSRVTASYKLSFIIIIIIIINAIAYYIITAEFVTAPQTTI